MVLRIRGGGPGGTGGIGRPLTNQPDSPPPPPRYKRPDHLHLDSLRTIWQKYARQHHDYTVIYPISTDASDSGFLHTRYLFPDMDFSPPAWCRQVTQRVQHALWTTWKVVNVDQIIAIMTASYFHDYPQLQTLRDNLPTNERALKSLRQPRDHSSQATEDWHTIICAILHYDNTCKFSNNKDLAQRLLQTKDRVIAYASPFDGIDGTLAAANSEIARSPPEWRGANALGATLMCVRYEIGGHKSIRYDSDITDIKYILGVCTCVYVCVVCRYDP